MSVCLIFAHSSLEKHSLVVLCTPCCMVWMKIKLTLALTVLELTVAEAILKKKVKSWWGLLCFFFVMRNTRQSSVFYSVGPHSVQCSSVQLVPFSHLVFTASFSLHLQCANLANYIDLFCEWIRKSATFSTWHVGFLFKKVIPCFFTSWNLEKFRKVSVKCSDKR